VLRGLLQFSLLFFSFYQKPNPERELSPSDPSAMDPTAHSVFVTPLPSVAFPPGEKFPLSLFALSMVIFFVSSASSTSLEVPPPYSSGFRDFAQFLCEGRERSFSRSSPYEGSDFDLAPLFPATCSLSSLFPPLPLREMIFSYQVRKKYPLK